MSRNAIPWHTCNITIYIYIHTPYTNCRMKGIMSCWNSKGWHYFACKWTIFHHSLLSVLIVQSMSHTFCLCNARPQAVSAALKIGMSARRSAGNPAMTWRASFHKCCWDNLVMLREASCRVRGPLQHTHFRKKQTPLPSLAGKTILRPSVRKFPNSTWWIFIHVIVSRENMRRCKPTPFLSTIIPMVKNAFELKTKKHFKVLENLFGRRHRRFCPVRGHSLSPRHAPARHMISHHRESVESTARI